MPQTNPSPTRIPCPRHSPVPATARPAELELFWHPSTEGLRPAHIQYPRHSPVPAAARPAELQLRRHPTAQLGGKDGLGAPPLSRLARLHRAAAALLVGRVGGDEAGAVHQLAAGAGLARRGADGDSCELGRAEQKAWKAQVQRSNARQEQGLPEEGQIVASGRGHGRMHAYVHTH